MKTMIVKQHHTPQSRYTFLHYSTIFIYVCILDILANENITSFTILHLFITNSYSNEQAIHEFIKLNALPSHLE